MVRPVVTDYKAFDERADEIINLKKENNQVRETILDLKQTIRENNYICLTAPQIGVNKRIMCINFKGDIRTMINPIIPNSTGWMLNREKCPSCENKEYIVPRNSKIKLMYTTPLGKYETIDLMGVAACAAQYGINILDGVLLCDFGLELDENWDKATEEERDEILHMYLESLDLQEKNVKKDIEEDPETKQLSDAIKFIESVQKGETKLDININDDDNK